ncbi:hypothetical protein NDU88_006075 [Pleurodeles waltl]|uniref:Uncharacterized protein n=1 Tax=Pleurodeles waltl TaxID=8319 RepID=A0AAV7VQB3_PLEWA|nr:hypothetical protein NDU88_006075 [Pleurodeles waltl]
MEGRLQAHGAGETRQPLLLDSVGYWGTESLSSIYTVRLCLYVLRYRRWKSAFKCTGEEIDKPLRFGSAEHWDTESHSSGYTVLLCLYVQALTSEHY